MRKIVMAVLGTICAAALSAKEPFVVRLYDDGPGDSNGLTGEETIRDGWFIGNVSDPSLTVYLPDNNQTGQAVVVCPGGGYAGVSWMNEGMMAARWLNERGIAAIILKYRMPNGNNMVPLNDAFRAMEITRANAREWEVNENQIGIMGFSAGGHLAASVLVHSLSPRHRPDFGILVYPVITMNKELTHKGSRDNLLGADYPARGVDEELFSIENHVSKDKTPDTFIVHCFDDRTVDVRNAIMFATALREEGVYGCEVHLYPQGGHGWGFSAGDGDRFPYRGEFYTALERWLKEKVPVLQIVRD